MENKTPISLEKAIQIAFSNSSLLETEEISYMESESRVLAKPVFSDISMPPYNKSAMDGYACKKEDLGNWLEMLEIIPAGSPPKYEIKKGTCSKIMTGAMVPVGADTVFIVEQSELNQDGRVRFNGTKTNSNICLTGEDLKTGDLVLPAGTLIRSQHIAMLATVGCTTPEVYRQPRVGIISTGSELVKAEQKPSVSQIRNSNGPQLVIQAQQCNFKVNYYGIVPDDEKATLEVISLATSVNDVTLISGGVSVGDYDYVPAVIEQLGFKTLFNKLTVKPGKHTTFALKEKKYIIGLPGNPVSSFIQFEIFAKPFLYKLINYEEKKIYLKMPLSSDFKRKNSDRDEFIPITVNDNNEAILISYHGSAHIHAYHNAFGFIKIPMGINQMRKGEFVNVRPL